MSNYDINGVGIPNGNFFGFPYSVEEAEVLLIPVPWDVTTSFKPGTSEAPEAIKTASLQLDFSDFQLNQQAPCKIGTLDYGRQIAVQNGPIRKKAAQVISRIENGEPLSSSELVSETTLINKACEGLNKLVYKTCSKHLKDNKLIGLVGGDHSTPFGLMQAVSERYPEFGILQIDAHADLRESYEGFHYSHASIMFNAIQQLKPKALVQVGIRDASPEELQLSRDNSSISLYSDNALSEKLFNGVSWKSICSEIVEKLPSDVYISFDVDGLRPYLCPNTGTPVPGGLEYNQVLFLINEIRISGRKIIGFDLSETGNSEWDGNVSARLLFALSNMMYASQKK